MSTTSQLVVAASAAQAQGNGELLEQIRALQAENARLLAMASAKQRVSFKVTDKGAVSVYGMGRWPVTLYRSQWAILLGQVDGLKAFIEANGAVLDGHEARYAAAKQDATAPNPVAAPSPEAAALAATALAAQELAARVDARLAS